MFIFSKEKIIFQPSCLRGNLLWNCLVLQKTDIPKQFREHEKIWKPEAYQIRSPAHVGVTLWNNLTFWKDLSHLSKSQKKHNKSGGPCKVTTYKCSEI